MKYGIVIRATRELVEQFNNEIDLVEAFFGFGIMRYESKLEITSWQDDLTEIKYIKVRTEDEGVAKELILGPVCEGQEFPQRPFNTQYKGR